MNEPHEPYEIPEIPEAAGAAETPPLRDRWPALDDLDRLTAFHAIPEEEREDFFHTLSSRGQAGLLETMPARARRLWLRLLPPDDAADVLQEAEPEVRAEFLALLDEPTRGEVHALLAYEEDDAGGLMSPRFARIRPDMRADEATRYLRRQAGGALETVYYAYVLDKDQRLVGVVSFRQLLLAQPDRPVSEFMTTDVQTVRDDMDQETVARRIAQHDLAAIPVVDADGRMRGIVTVDDIVDVVQEEATEDIQKIGGMEALDSPYLRTGFGTLLKKRGGWLAVLFLGEMLTATAMSYYEAELAHALVLALFLPLIIASGGNAGSQASTLIVRAIALGEVRLANWWRVARREALTGLALGGILATIGLLRIVLWQAMFHTYGEHYGLIAATVSISVVGIVCVGTLAGSLLPFLLRALRFDPASASVPLVATLVDVSGLVIYFSVARLILHGTLL
jgi:magnesium transporter